MNHPIIHINNMGLVLSVIASFLFGWLWYGPLFGKKWARLMNMPLDFKPDKKVMLRSMTLTLLGTFLTSYVLAHASEVWRPSAWGVGTDLPFYYYGFFAGFFTWIGYYIPLLLGSISWEGKSWGLFGLNATYHFINLQLIAMTLSCLR